jgi:hypothetical protein
VEYYRRRQLSAPALPEILPPDQRWPFPAGGRSAKIRVAMGLPVMSRDLAISCDHIEWEPLLEEWRWLVPADATPLMIGIFGDWIFGAPDASHWHLDLLEGHFKQIAKDSADFNAKKMEQKYRDDWFGANWADIALSNGLIPKIDECLGWKIAPFLGGPFSSDNIQVYSLRVYQSIMGQLFRQVAGQ